MYFVYMTLHSSTSPVLDAGCHSRYLLLFCMYGLCTVPLLLSRMPGVILGISSYSVCMDSAQSHFSCPGCRVSFSVSVPVLYVWTLHSPTSPVLDAGCHSRYLSLFCMYGLCTVPLLLSRMPGVILGICPYSVCMDSAQSHFSCPGCRVSFSVSVLILYVWTLHSPTSPVPDAGCHSRYLSLFCMYGLCTVPLLLSRMPGVILGICSHLCMYGLCTVPLLCSLQREHHAVS
ncbi:unnamed protein product, partial [Staurois parvus]